jgi:hypothetical protein
MLDHFVAKMQISIQRFIDYIAEQLLSRKRIDVPSSVERTDHSLRGITLKTR